MQKRHINRIQYFEEQEYTTLRYVIPLIEKYRPLNALTHILEIGCGEGGNLKPFLDLGCRVTGIDISENKINLANSYLCNYTGSENLHLILDDVYNLKTPVEKFDVIIMRDVIEHIHDQKRFMAFVKQFMHQDSLFFLAFPPWQNPFGGHQQICKNKMLALLPWYHLLPGWLYRRILKSGGESEATIANLLEVKETGISIETFERFIDFTGFRIISKKFWFINPNYEIKFGLKPVKQPVLISGVPRLRNFLITSAYYLLSPIK
jgi:SAM-dependent methyltransferase